MSLPRTMGAGNAGASRSIRLNGITVGDKLQGLSSTIGRRGGINYAGSYGNKRDVIFSMNQLGGVGRKKTMFLTGAGGGSGEFSGGSGTKFEHASLKSGRMGSMLNGVGNQEAVAIDINLVADTQDNGTTFTLNKTITTISSGYYLYIPTGSTLIISSKQTLTGSITNDGGININSGYINNNKYDTFINNGTFFNAGGLNIDINGTFINNGTFFNDVQIVTHGTFTNNYTFTNRGGIINDGNINNTSGATFNHYDIIFNYPAGKIGNSGTFTYYSWSGSNYSNSVINNTGYIHNEYGGIFNNDNNNTGSTVKHFMNLAGGRFVNRYGAEFNNTSPFTNSGADTKFNNNGIFTNSGTFTNDSDAEFNNTTGTLALASNTGQFNNHAFFTNDAGTFTNNAGGKFTNGHWVTNNSNTEFINDNGAEFINIKLITNAGTIDNKPNATFNNNTGAIINNTGTLNGINAGSGTITGDGTINP